MRKLDSETLLRGSHIEVCREHFRRADGSEVERDVVRHPGSVAILAHDGEAVHLVRQPREAVDDDGLLEIPAGTLDVEGESRLACAQRELAEEAGLRAEHWEELQTLYPSPGFLDEVVTVFEATGLSQASAEADEDEQIEIVRLPLADISSEISALRDATTLVALLLLDIRRR